MPLLLQLYEIDDNPKRREFLDELFAFMQKRGEFLFVLLEAKASLWFTPVCSFVS